MRAFVPLASFVVLASTAGCSGFTEIGEGAGKAGMAGSSSGTSGSAGDDSGGSSSKGGSGQGGSGASSKGGTSSRGGTNAGGTDASGGTGENGGSGASGGTGGTAGSGYEPCAGKSCGATCTQCAPDDADCAETAVVKYCDVSGGCGSNFPVCGGGECMSVADCGITDVACSPCADGTYSCPTVDCIDGKCVHTYPTCPAPECKQDADCPISLAPCQLCADGSSACPWAHCESGKCSAGLDTCDDTDPCKGKACGDICTTYVGGADGAAVPAVVMYCDENLKCQLNLPECSAAQCKENADCNTDVCGLCPNTSTCAAQVCVEGKCTFECPTDPCGGCTPPQVCVHQVGGPAGGVHYLCAEQLPCGAASACACLVDQGTCKPEKVDGVCECDNGLE